MKPTVLFEDSELVAVAKESGALVHNSRYAGPREVSLRERVIAHVGAPVFPLHRLDRGTSGVVLFAKNTSDVARLSATLSAGQKRYVAFIRGHFFGAAWIDHPLKQPDGSPKAALTTCRVLARSKTERISAVEIVLATGRLHQARRHLKHLSHPIIGDVKYGKGPFNRLAKEKYGVDRLALHAVQVRLSKAQWVTAPLPAAMATAWKRLFALEDTAQTAYALLDTKNS